MERAVSGTFAEHNAKCSRCMSCKNCKKMLINTATSIRNMQEDLIFQSCVKIDEETDEVITWLPIASDYPTWLSYNRQPTAGRLRREMVKIKSLYDSKRQVKETFAGYRESKFILKLEEMTPEQQEIVKNSLCNHYMQCTIAYKISYHGKMKARICMDASANSQGQSLNKNLPTGDTSSIDIVRTFQNFLTMPVIILGDVKSYYPSHRLHPSQWSIQRFLWIDDLDPDGTPTEYYLVRLFFGLAPVARLCSVALEKLGEKYPHLEKVFTRDFYVDDILLNTFHRLEARRLRRELESVMNKHHFEIKEWFENKQPAVGAQEDGSLAFLGCKYFPEEDFWTMKVPPISKGVSKKGNTEMLKYYKGDSIEELKEFYDHNLTLRKLLSKIMQFFDCSGVSSPILGSFRYMIRTCTKASGGAFDMILAEKYLEEFCRKVLELNKFKEYRYPRTFHAESPTNEDITICLFTDAGLIAKQVVAYTLMEKPGYDGTNPKDRYTVSFLGARNALVKELESVPRSELDALWMGAIMYEAQRRNFHPKNVTVRVFIDSQVVGKWAVNWEINLQVYHRVRIAQILNTFTDKDGTIQIYWVKRYLNVADCGTHLNEDVESVSPTSKFFRGEEFLRWDLSEIEKHPDISRVDKLTGKLSPEQLKEFNEGVAIKSKQVIQGSRPTEVSPNPYQEHKLSGEEKSLISRQDPKETPKDVKEQEKSIKDTEKIKEVPEKTSENIEEVEKAHKAEVDSKEVPKDATISETHEIHQSQLIQKANESYPFQTLRSKAKQAQIVCRKRRIVEAHHVALEPKRYPTTLERSKMLYTKARYIMNPLRMSFGKVTLTHMVVLKALLKWLAKCEAVSIERNDKKNTYKEIRLRIIERQRECLGMASAGSTDYTEFQQLCINKSLRRDLEQEVRFSTALHGSYTCRSDLFRSNSNPKAKKGHCDVSNSLNASNLEEVKRSSEEMYDSYVTLSIQNRKASESRSLAFALSVKPNPKRIPASNRRSWQRYPGIYFTSRSIVNLRRTVPKLIEGKLNDQEKLNTAACMVNVQRSLDSMKRWPLLTLISNTIRKDYWEATKALDRSHIIQLQKSITDYIRKPETYILNHQIIAMRAWLRVDRVTIADPSPPEVQTLLEEYVPKRSLIEVFTNRSEFSGLQLLTFELFHRIMTKELQLLWSEAKIQKYCEMIKDKYVALWRLRAGHEVNKLLGTQYELSERKIIDVSPTFPSVVPVGAKESLIVWSLIRQIHFDKGLNILGRTQMFNHRSMFENRSQLFHNVYVPGAMEIISKINQNCVSCRVRLGKYMQSSMGPLPPAMYRVGSPFMAVQVDALGPYTIKMRPSGPDTRGRSFKSTPYLLVFTCIQSRMVHIEPIDDHQAASVVQAITCMAGRWQIPSYMYFDRHPAQMHIKEKAEFQARINHILMRNLKIMISAIPVGHHYKNGAVEAAIKRIEALLGVLNMEDNITLTSNGLRALLAQIEDLINSTPLGVTLNQKDAAMQLLTPYNLAGVVKRSPFGPGYVPLDVKDILSDNYRKWKQVVAIYDAVVIPNIIKERKWHKANFDSVEIGDIVMFKRKIGNNFSETYSLAKISNIFPSSDKEPRKIEVTYFKYQAKDSKEVLEGTPCSSGGRRTVRDNHDLIILGDATSEINKSLADLNEALKHQEISECLIVSNTSVTQEVPTKNRCLACTSSINLPSSPCKLCLLTDLSETTEVVVTIKEGSKESHLSFTIPREKLSEIANDIKMMISQSPPLSKLFSQIKTRVLNNAGFINQIKKSGTIQGRVDMIVQSEDGLIDSFESELDQEIDEKIREERLNHKYKYISHHKNLKSTLKAPDYEPDNLNVDHVAKRIKWPQIQLTTGSESAQSSSGQPPSHF